MLIVLRDGTHDGKQMEVANDAEFVEVPLKAARRNLTVRYFATAEEQDGRRVFRPIVANGPIFDR